MRPLTWACSRRPPSVRWGRAVCSALPWLPTLAHGPENHYTAAARSARQPALAASTTAPEHRDDDGHTRGIVHQLWAAGSTQPRRPLSGVLPLALAARHRAAGAAPRPAALSPLWPLGAAPLTGAVPHL